MIRKNKRHNLYPIEDFTPIKIGQLSKFNYLRHRGTIYKIRDMAPFETIQIIYTAPDTTMFIIGELNYLDLIGNNFNARCHKIVSLFERNYREDVYFKFPDEEEKNIQFNEYAFESAMITISGGKR